MIETRYKKRLQKDLDRWIETGLVDAVHRESILADIAAPLKGWSASGALAILGSVLLAFAATSFVAANWTGLGNITRLALMLSGLWGCYLGAGQAFRREHPGLGHALAILGAALFGVAIVLVAQIFNMSSWRYTVIGIWTLGAIITALLTPSRPVLILASILGTAWVWMETFNPYAPGVLWAYLPLWTLTMGTAMWLRSKVSANLLALGLNIWLAFMIWDFAQTDRLSALQSSAVFILATTGTAMVFAALRDREAFGFGVLANWGTSLGLMAGFCIQFPLDRYEAYAQSVAAPDADVTDRWLNVAGVSGPDYWVLATVFAGLLGVSIAWRFATNPGSRTLAIPAAFAGGLALLLPWVASALGGENVLFLRIFVGVSLFTLSVALILYGAKEGRRFAGSLGVALFIAQTLYVYWETFGDLLDTSLFFLVGGLLLLALSFGVIRFQKRIAPIEKALS
jgi:uncharacterized membrane protein